MIKVNGIIKNNKHSFDDFGLWIVNKEIGIPNKKRITTSIPYMNGKYDFSNLYGESVFEERTLKYVFEMVEDTKELLNIKKIIAINWLSSDGKEYIYDDTLPGFKFYAECIKTTFSENGTIGKLTVEFTAYPFKISKYNEGNIPWDDFNFELDYLQETKFNVSGSKAINIINSGSKRISPTIICSSNFDIVKNDITYKFNSGTTKDWRFTLDKGDNNLILKGTGNIEFIFRKEVL